MEDKELREQIHDKLLFLVDTTLADPNVGPQIQSLLDSFRLTRDDLKREVLAYTLNKGSEGYVNDHYQKTIARATLYFHNLVPGTYHRKRHELVSSFLRKTKAKKVIDIGYGVPGSYTFEFLREHHEATMILADQDPSAEEFARAVIQIEDEKLLLRVQFAVYNMDSQEYPGNADAYIYLDSIEHTEDPTGYLRKMVGESVFGSHFIFSLPICTMQGLENFHYAEWLTDEAAKDWVKNAGLKIIETGSAFPNLAVDFFAELTPGGYHNLLILAQKK